MSTNSNKNKTASSGRKPKAAAEQRGSQNKPEAETLAKIDEGVEPAGYNHGSSEPASPIPPAGKQEDHPAGDKPAESPAPPEAEQTAADPDQKDEEEVFIERLNHHLELRPTPGMEGVFYRCKWPSGIEAFLWFPDRWELLMFLMEYAVDLNVGPACLDHNQLRMQVIRFTEQAIDGELPTDKYIQQVNATLEQFIEIEWIGHFEELVTGDGPFPVRARQRFRESLELPHEGNDPIPDREVEAFTDFLCAPHGGMMTFC
jgi:hypothetical protein